MKNILHKILIVCAILMVGITLLSPTENTALAQTGGETGALAVMYIAPDMITWQPLVDYARLTLVVVAPSGAARTSTFDSGNIPILSVGELPGDGVYKYELQLTPMLDAKTLATMQNVSEDPDMRTQLGEDLTAAGVLPAVTSQAGSFTISSGQFVIPVEEEVSVSSPSGTSDGGSTINDVVHADDLIVQSSICAGFDCVNGESFGFDTIILKENNLRILFNDTSTSGGFPTNNWRITVNDSANGGASYFSIDDADRSVSPFKIEAGSPANSFYVEDYGRIGLGTSTPVMDLHIKGSNTPSIRLEQDSSMGWFPQTWDIAGNEVGFFIRDVTNGSKIPFRIQDNTPSNTLNLKSSGYVGIGTWSPEYALEVERTGINSEIVAQRTDGAMAVLSAITNTVQIGSITNHPIEMVIDEIPVMTVTGEGEMTLQGASGAVGAFSAISDTVRIGSLTESDVEMVVNDNVVMTMNSAGNMTLQGALSEYSDVNVKENFAEVDGYEVLERLNNIPVLTWNYIHDDANIQHMGPMAQDFYAAYGLGADNRHIAALDVNGVSLAAIQTLNKITNDQKTQIDVLSAENTALKEQVNDLESRLSKLEQVTGKANDTRSTGLSIWSLVVVVVLVGLMQAAPVVYRKVKGE